MLSRLRWQELPDSLSRVATDIDGQGTDLGVFLFLPTCSPCAMAAV
jgi:hypothetical protein